MNSKSLQCFNVYDYSDYRILLKEFYEFQKKRIRSFSYRYFAVKSGVSASLFSDIVEGRRRLSIPVMKKYAAAMNISQKETDYFGAVVKFNNSKTTDEKNIHLTELLRLRGNSSIKFIDKSQYEFFRTWYHSALREMVTLPEFKEDYEWIASKCIPRITVSQAKKSFEIMLQLGILRRNKNGILELSDAVISSEYEMKSLIIRNFQSEVIELARNALERFEPAEREISSLTLGVSRHCYIRIKERIRMFKEDLLKMVLEDTTRSEMICQCNFQLFPLVEADSTVTGDTQ